MRRIVSAALIALFLVQSAPAAAAPSVDTRPIISAIESSWLFAVVTGRTARYEQTHWFTPNIPRGPGPRMTPNPMSRGFVKRLLVASVSGGRGNATIILPERVGKPISAALPQFTMRTPRRITRQFVTRQGQSSVVSTTGIRDIWTYEERALPGIGKAMTNVANGNVVVQADDLEIPERGVDFAFRR